MDPLQCDLVATLILSGGLLLAYLFAALAWLDEDEGSAAAVPDATTSTSSGRLPVKLLTSARTSPDVAPLSPLQHIDTPRTP